MLKSVHEGHLGIKKSTRKARDVTYRSQINSDIEKAVKACYMCQKCRSTPSKVPMLVAQEKLDPGAK